MSQVRRTSTGFFCVLCLLVIGGAFGTRSFATTVAAQTHPCDQPAPATVTIVSGAPHKVQLCLPQTAAAEAILAVIDATPFDLLPITAKTAPSTTGQVLYESGAFLQVAKGSHTLTVRAYNRNQLTGQMQLGDPSPPFSFAAVDDTPVAAAPKVITIIR
jgi:hypothetical protein